MRMADDALQAGTTGGLDRAHYLGEITADFHSLVNFIAMVVQLFLVSRIFRWFGVRGAIFFLPLVSLFGNLGVGLGASLLVIRSAKALENGTDYSLMNTVRHSLFLVTSRESKYKAKAAIDTFFVRSGDVLSAIIVFIGTTVLALGVEGFGRLNVALILLWLLVCTWIAREHRRLEARPGSELEGTAS